MNFVQPIRDQETIDGIKEYLMNQSYRNYMMFVFGINTGLRIQDILKVRVRGVLSEQLITIEMKTRKRKFLQLNPYASRDQKVYRNDEDVAE